MRKATLVTFLTSAAFMLGVHAETAEKTEAETTDARLGTPTLDKAELCDAQSLKRGKPKYPGAALRARAEGWVVLSFDLDGSGKASNVEIVNSKPEKVFDLAARDSVKHETFVEGFKKTGCKTVITFSLG